MNREETKLIIRVIKNSYPNFKIGDPSEMIDVWTSILSEYPYHAMELALANYIRTDTSGFAPSIGQLINHFDNIENGMPEVDVQAKWNLIRKAARNSIYNAEEEFEKLPEDLKDFYKTPDSLKAYAIMESDALEQVEKGRFFNQYKAYMAQKKEIRKSITQIRENVPKLETREAPMLAEPDFDADYDGEETEPPKQITDLMASLKKMGRMKMNPATAMSKINFKIEVEDD